MLAAILPHSVSATNSKPFLDSSPTQPPVIQQGDDSPPSTEATSDEDYVLIQREDGIKVVSA